MGNFLTVVPARALLPEATTLFRSGVELARRHKSQTPSHQLEMDWVCTASFPRRNGSGTPIVVDPATGCWLQAIGTWFHAQGYATGAEARLLNRYLEIDPRQLGRELEGFFVIVIGDARSREVIVITDIVGSCHGFARTCEEGVALSGSSLVLAGLKNFKLDPIGCQEFLNTGVIYEDRTLYAEVRKLGPASVFRFAQGALKDQQRYWNISDVAVNSLGGREAVARMWDTLRAAAQKIADAFPRPVCDLTGGYDSRAMVAGFLGVGSAFATTVSGDEDNPDVVVSRGLAQLTGMPHLCLPRHEDFSFSEIKSAIAYTDGEYPLAEYAGILRIHRQLQERFDISINGSYGEVARGYWWELLAPHTGTSTEFDAHKVARLRFAVGKFDPTLMLPERRIDLVAHFTDVIERTNVGLQRLPNTLQMDNTYLTMRMQRWQGRIASSTNQLWPCLSPFLFRSVLETMLATKPQLRQRSLLIRCMLAAFQPRLAAFPLEHGYPAIPATWKTFYRFWPIFGHYGKKVVTRVRRAISASHALSARNPALRMRLWSEEEVRELLDPTKMQLSGLFNGSALVRYLAESQKENFLYEEQWQRLLSMETTLNALAQTGARPRI